MISTAGSAQTSSKLVNTFCTPYFSAKDCFFCHRFTLHHTASVLFFHCLCQFIVAAMTPQPASPSLPSILSLPFHVFYSHTFYYLLHSRSCEYPHHSLLPSPAQGIGISPCPSRSSNAALTGSTVSSISKSTGFSMIMTNSSPPAPQKYAPTTSGRDIHFGRSQP